MNTPLRSDAEGTGSTRVMDAVIRVALVFGLAYFCYRVFSPFMNLAVWSVILAVTLYPLHQKLAKRVWGKQWLASVLLVVVGLVLIVTPTALLMNSFADSVGEFISAVQEDRLAIPPPSENVQNWPLVGKKIYGAWSQAHTDLPATVKKFQPKIGELTRTALGYVAGIFGTLLGFLASFIVAAILMAYGEAGANSTLAIFKRIAGPEKGTNLANLSTATIRTVALGVIGIAAIQALLVGLALLLAGVPAAGVLAIIVLVLGIAQIPAIVVVLPAIIYIWTSGTHDTTSALIYTVILLLTGLADNVLKPLLLGRGVDAPMPVILFGALGGMAGGGILGMFVGAVALALGYEIFMAWVSNSPEETDTVSDPGVSPAPGVTAQTAG